MSYSPSTHADAARDYSGALGKNEQLALDEPITWAHEGQRFRLTDVGVLLRFECETSRGWIMIAPDPNLLALMTGCKRLLNQIGRAQACITHIRAGRGDRIADKVTA